MTWVFGHIAGRVDVSSSVQRAAFSACIPWMVMVEGEPGEPQNMCTKPALKREKYWKNDARLRLGLSKGSRKTRTLAVFTKTVPTGVTGVRSTTPTATTIVAIGRRFAAQLPLMHSPVLCVRCYPMSAPYRPYLTNQAPVQIKRIPRRKRCWWEIKTANVLQGLLSRGQCCRHHGRPGVGSEYVESLRVMQRSTKFISNPDIMGIHIWYYGSL